MQEIFDYGNYDDAEFTCAAMGFGTTAEDDPPMLFLPGVIVSMWGGQVRSLADNLDIKLDEVRQRTERWFTPERIDCTMMTVEPGQKLRFQYRVIIHAGDAKSANVAKMWDKYAGAVASR